MDSSIANYEMVCPSLFSYNYNYYRPAIAIDILGPRGGLSRFMVTGIARKQKLYKWAISISHNNYALLKSLQIF